MQPIRRILVAVKNPEGTASPAVIKAGQLALALGADVELFHAVLDHLACDLLIVKPLHFKGRVARALRGVKLQPEWRAP
jgi:hypothetical protein